MAGETDATSKMIAPEPISFKVSPSKLDELFNFVIFWDTKELFDESCNLLSGDDSVSILVIVGKEPIELRNGGLWSALVDQDVIQHLQSL